MDLDKNSFLGSQMGIQSIPTFLFVYKGQVVKKQSGANQNTIIQNIEWMKSTYNLSTAPVEAPKKAPNQLEGFKIYKETVQPYFFSQDNWSAPIAKINQFFEEQKLYSKSDLSEVCLALKNQTGFAQTSSANKIVVSTAVISYSPINDCENLLAFIDFLRIGVLDQEINLFVAESIYDLLEKLLNSYYIEKKISEESNPKNVRIIIWRLIANLTKFESGRDLLFSIYDQVLMAAYISLTDLKDNDAMVKSMSMAINNLIFAEYGLECDDDIKYQLFNGFAENLSSPTENTVIATLNVLCRLSKGNKDMIALIKKENSALTVKLAGLKLSQNEIIAQFAEDLLFIFK